MDTRKLSRFLQNLTWAGDMIPIVEFRTIHNGELDVLIIKKSNRVPFYITKKCNKVRENQIYVRKVLRTLLLIVRQK